MASVVHKGTASPLARLDHARQGRRLDKRDLVRKLLLLLPPERIRLVMADREFIGSPFMGYLTERGVGYGVRIRKGARVGFLGRTRGAAALFEDLAVGQHRRLRLSAPSMGKRCRSTVCACLTARGVNTAS